MPYTVKLDWTQSVIWQARAAVPLDEDGGDLAEALEVYQVEGWLPDVSVDNDDLTTLKLEWDDDQIGRFIICVMRRITLCEANVNDQPRNAKFWLFELVELWAIVQDFANYRLSLTRSRIASRLPVGPITQDPK